MHLVATNELPNAGTYNSNPLCLAAVVATLRELSRDNGKVIRYISEMGAKLRIGLNRLFQKHGFPMKADGVDSVFVVTSPVVELRDYRDYLKLDFDFIYRFHDEMMSRRILFLKRGNMMLSAAHTGEDIEQTLEAAEQVITSW